MRRVHLMTIALHLLVLALPGLGLAVGAPDAKLFGTEPPSIFPALSMARWTDESVQAGLKAWFESHLGFRGVLVRTDNSLFYATLGTTRPEATVKRNGDGFLFIDDDLWYAALRVQDRPKVERLRALAVLLGRAQRELARSGKHLVVVLAPAKSTIYPEAVSEGWRRRQPAPEPTDAFVVRTLREAFAAEGVRYGDGIATMQGFATSREIIYPRVARHWSRVGACLVLRDAARPAFDISSCDYYPRTANFEEDSDIDLYRLLNTWHVTEPVPTIFDLRVNHPPTPDAPRALFVGTSFTWMLVDAARSFVREPHLFYYNSSIFDVSAPKARLVGNVDPNSAEWAHYALDKDVYVIEILEAYAHGGVVPDFLQALLARHTSP